MTSIDGKRVEINRGDIYWLKPEDSDHPHPHVVIQDDIINHSPVKTVVVCALTSNRKRAMEPGNILLDEGEANLSRHSVIVVSKVAAVDKSALGDYIGTLSPERVAQIFAGMRLQQRSFLTR